MAVFSRELVLIPLVFLLTVCSYLYSYSPTSTAKQPNQHCSIEMFGFDENAFRACLSLQALQHNWYPSPIAGLYAYQTWNGFDGFWQDGAVLETLANFMFYGDNAMYKSVLTGSLRNLSVLDHAYAPHPSYDDMGWYAISYLRIYEVLNSQGEHVAKFLEEARLIYDWIWEKGWDKNKTCGGGFWFDQNKSDKKTVENAQMLLIGGKLFRLTNDHDLLEKINLTWNFLERNHIINNVTYLVADGVAGNCSDNGFYGPSYNMGLMISGLLEYGQAFNRTDEFVHLAHKIAEASNKFITRSGVLVEYCTPTCDDDQKMFKGIYLRNLRYLMDFMRRNKKYHDSKALEYFQELLQFNSDAVWKYNRCEPTLNYCDVIFKDGPSLSKGTLGPVFGINFLGPFNEAAPMQQTAALDLFVSAIKHDTRCQGKDCIFDPLSPQTKPLTCNDDPCPIAQQCCESGSSYTCCDETQYCNNGECQ